MLVWGELGSSCYHFELCLINDVAEYIRFDTHTCLFCTLCTDIEPLDPEC